MKNWYIYVACTVVLAVSIFVGFFIFSSPISQVILSIPAAGSLVLAVYKIWREDRAHDRSLELQYKQQDFILGAASHMADVAYDRHVIFCEEYINKVQEGFQELMQKGPTRQTINIGGDLVRVRIKHAAWLTKEIEDKLKPFEQALINIGAREHLLESLPVGEQRSRVVEEVFQFFNLIIGNEKTEKEEEKIIAKDAVIAEIRKILGVDALTTLRQKTTEVALERISK